MTAFEHYLQSTYHELGFFFPEYVDNRHRKVYDEKLRRRLSLHPTRRAEVMSLLSPILIIICITSNLYDTSFAIATPTDHIDAVHRAEFERLVLGVQYDVDHGAHVGRYDVVGGDEPDALLQPLLVGLVRPETRDIAARVTTVTGSDEGQRWRQERRKVRSGSGHDESIGEQDRRAG